MKKIVDLLEQKVQWIVLAIGLCYVGYIAYAYLLVPRVSVPFDQTRVGPGEIDKRVYEGRVSDLENKLRKPVGVTIPVQKSFASEFRDSMTYKSEQAAPIASSSTLWPQTVLKFSPAELPRSDVPVGPGGIPAPRPALPESDLVTSLPDISGVKARIADWRTGMSFVVPPDAKADAPVNPVDKTWVTVRFEIDPAALAKAWDERKIPDRNSNTSFLQITLERQEKKSDGSWGDATPVPHLSFAQLQTMPENNALSPQTIAFKEWAAQHQFEIIQPGFYTVSKGDGWAPPGVDVPNDPNQNQPKFDAKQYITSTPAELAKLNLTNEQKQAILREKAKQKQPARNAAPQPARGRPAPAAPATPRPGPGDFGPLDPDRPVSYQARGGRGAPASGDILPPSGPDADQGPQNGNPAAQGAPSGPAAAPPPAPTAPGAPVPTKTHFDQYPPPAGEFDPHKWVADHPTHPLIVGWAHDETVEPGHVYRYRISYRVKNPVFFSTASVRDPKLADVFYIAGPAGDWSDEVEVSSPVSFYLVRAGLNNGSVSVKVFRRQEGSVKAKVFDVLPGDPIGGKDGDVDYSTDWTLVDVRKDSHGEAFVLLMDKFGLIYRRDLKADSSDPKFLELNSLASSSASVAP